MPRTDRNRNAACFGELDRVTDEVLHDAAERPTVEACSDVFGGSVDLVDQLQSLLVSKLLIKLDELPGFIGDVQQVELDVHLLRLQLGEGHDRVQRIHEPSAASLDQLCKPFVLIAYFLRQHGSIADYPG